VDATIAKDLAGKFGIQGFPTLKFFPSATADPVEYQAGREAADIVKYVKSKSGPVTKKLESVSEMDKLTNDVIVYGLFAADSAEHKAFEEAAVSVDDATFAYFANAATLAAARTALGQADASIVLVQKFTDEPVNQIVYKESATTATKISAFVSGHLLPSVIPFTTASAPKIFRGPIKTHFLLFADPEAPSTKGITAEFRKTAEAKTGKALFVTVAPSEDRIFSYFGITEADIPTAVLVSMPDGEQMKKFAFPKGNELVSSKFSEFLNDYLAGKLKAFLKSDEIPASPTDNGVTVVVGKNFNDIVLNKDKDVLLEFYAPWCGHCKSLAPEYEKLAARFASVKHVTIAKVDATANEVEYEGVNVKGFPTLIFFPAGENKVVVEYDGSRDLAGLTAFLKKNVKRSFKLENDGEEDDDMEL
jgi:protein disulfide-isomerase A1